MLSTTRAVHTSLTTPPKQPSLTPLVGGQQHAQAPMTPNRGVLAQDTHNLHSAHMTGRNWGAFATIGNILADTGLAMSNGYRARIYPRDTGIWSSPSFSVHCIVSCTAAQARSAPNVALRSPRRAAIQCFMGRLGQLIPLPYGIWGGGVSLTLAVDRTTLFEVICFG